MSLTGPPVTVVDPRGSVAPLPAVRRWEPSRLELGLALVVAAVLLLDGLVVRDLRRPDPLTAVVVGVAETFDRDEGVLRLDLVVTSTPREQRRITGLRAERGWRALGSTPRATAPSLRLALAHSLECDREVRAPRHLIVETDAGDLRAPVRDLPRSLEGCDPFPLAAAVRAQSSSVRRAGGVARVTVDLVDLSTRAVSVTGVERPGFAFRETRPLPLALVPRPRGERALLRVLEARTLEVSAEVVDCPTSRAVLDGAARSRRPDDLTLRLGDEAASIDVPGVTAYLEQQWQDACVR